MWGAGCRGMRVGLRVWGLGRTWRKWSISSTRHGQFTWWEAHDLQPLPRGFHFRMYREVSHVLLEISVRAQAHIVSSLLYGDAGVIGNVECGRKHQAPRQALHLTPYSLRPSPVTLHPLPLNYREAHNLQALQKEAPFLILLRGSFLGVIH